MKRAMGLGGARSYFVSQFVAFMGAFPLFSESQVYPRGDVKREYRVGQTLRVKHGPVEFRLRVCELDASGRPLRLLLAA